MPRPSSNKGIPAGGLFRGAEVRKTAEQQAIWGGTAGARYDRCYHEACDTFATTAYTRSRSTPTRSRSRCSPYAYSTETVNGVPGMNVPGNFTIPAPTGPEGTVGSDDGAEHEHHEGS